LPVNDIPDQFSLLSAYPNPFNATTTLSYNIPIASNASIKIFDARGSLVSTLTSGMQSAGVHEAMWDAMGNPSGIYFVRLEAGIYSETSKIVLMK
jgi:flagellar hook assembly protein FlgD